jgi:hypothetical protein
MKPTSEHQTYTTRVNIIMTQTHDKPSIELRRTISDMEDIKEIISCAIHEKPILVYPTFTDKLKSLGILVEKGIVYKDSEDGKYYFTF